MVTKLQLYNFALGHLGPVRLSTLAENRSDRKELDAVYDGVMQGMLERGLWYFALRTVHLDPDTDVETLFGLPYAYSLPSDFVRIRLISPDERQETEDRTYRREGQYIYSDYAELYLSYVSNGVNFGQNIGGFTQLYAEAFGAELAYQSGLPITKDSAKKNDLLVIKERMLIKAKRTEAVDERVKMKPLSSWVMTRFNDKNRSQRRSPSSTGIGDGT